MKRPSFPRGQACLWLALLLLVPVQSTVMPRLWGVHPNLAVLLVYGVALVRPPFTAALVGGAAGLLLDAASGRMVGIQVLSLFLTGYAVGIFKEQFFRTTLLLHLAGLLLAALLEGTLAALLLISFGFPLVPGTALLRVILPQALSTAGLGLILGLLVPARFLEEERSKPREALAWKD